MHRLLSRIEVEKGPGVLDIIEAGVVSGVEKDLEVRRVTEVAVEVLKSGGIQRMNVQNATGSINFTLIHRFLYLQILYLVD